MICARFPFRLRTSHIHVPRFPFLVVYKTALLVPSPTQFVLPHKPSLIRYMSSLVLVSTSALSLVYPSLIVTALDAAQGVIDLITSTRNRAIGKSTRSSSYETHSAQIPLYSTVHTRRCYQTLLCLDSQEHCRHLYQEPTKG